jgi:hypothetical protein
MTQGSLVSVRPIAAVRRSTPLDSAQKRRRPPPMAEQLGEAVVDRRRQGFDAARVPSLSPLVRSAERRAGRRPVATPARGPAA